MAISSGMIEIITQLKAAIDGEKNNLERDITSAINKIVSETGKAFDAVFNEIREGLRDSGEFVEKDFKALEKLLDTVVRKIESVAEREYHNFESKVDGVIHGIEGTAKKATEEVAHATEYIRNKVYGEFETALKGARKDFEDAKNDFNTTIEKLGNDLVSKVKSGVKTIVSSSQNDLDKIQKLRNEIDDDLREKVKEVEAELRKLKEDATAELDRISGFMHKELEKMETRVKSMKKEVDSVAAVVGGTALIAAIAIAISMFSYSKSSQESNKPTKARNIPGVETYDF
jgi:hypothetical protein